MATVHMHDSGVQFLITVNDESGPVNLTSVQNINLYFKKPDNSIITRLCSTINALTGLIQYVSTDTDFDQVGKWNLQIVVRFASNNVKHSDIGILTVEDNISGT